MRSCVQTIAVVQLAVTTVTEPKNLEWHIIASKNNHETLRKKLMQPQKVSLYQIPELRTVLFLIKTLFLRYRPENFLGSRVFPIRWPMFIPQVYTLSYFNLH